MNVFLKTKVKKKNKKKLFKIVRPKFKIVQKNFKKTITKLENEHKSFENK